MKLFKKAKLLGVSAVVAIAALAAGCAHTGNNTPLELKPRVLSGAITLTDRA